MDHGATARRKISSSEGSAAKKPSRPASKQRKAGYTFMRITSEVRSKGIDSDVIITSFDDHGSKLASGFGAKMRAIIKCSAIILSLAVVTPANAKGCLKGALIGGVAGHYTVHHGLLGAAAGCIIGRHEAKKRAQMERERTEHPTLRDGEDRL